LLENGATIATEHHHDDAWQDHDVLVLLPHDVEKNEKISAHASKIAALSVSELWLERCMLEKSFIKPQDYPLGQIIQKPTMMGFSKLTINATGFDALETLHISKMITLLGGDYVQVFTSKVSLLVCKSGSSNQQKLQLAQHSSIPVVTEAWLWAVLKTSRKPPVDRYLVQPITGVLSKTEVATTSDRTKPDTAYVEVSTIPLKHQARPQQVKQSHQGQSRRKSLKSKMQEDAATDNHHVHVHKDLTEEPEQHIDHGSSTLKSTSSTSTNNETQGGSFAWVEPPLKEVNTNSPAKKPRTHGEKNDLVASYDGICNIQESDLKMNETPDSRCETKGSLTEDTNGKATAVLSLNGAIRELLDQQSRKKHTTASSNNESSTKGRLIGRALSNLSNTSAASNTRLSRAGSVESINTDGIGSEIASMPSGKQSSDAMAAAEKSGFSLMGRAKSTLTGIKPSALGLDDPDMVRGNFQAEEEAPQMTQLGYEDPEEAVLLREKLAEYRRKRSRQGQKDNDPKPVMQQKRERKIRDDDVLMTGGWGTGRRTRNRPKSPPDQEITKF
jgi:DNA replication regulator DPB11